MALEQKYTDSIRAAQNSIKMQPVLFTGSGFTKRYYGLPSWQELISHIIEMISYPQTLHYLSAKYNGDLAQAAEELVDATFEWVWGSGKNNFSLEDMAQLSAKSDAIKLLCRKIIADHKTSTSDSSLLNELVLFKKILPQAVITTNYDTCLEENLPDYAPIIGSSVYKYNIASIGEIYKIHGSVTAPPSMVLTASDYVDYDKKRHYLSAKLITLFAENPVFILGYSISDQNVARLICDVGEVIATEGNLIPNLFYVQRRRVNTAYPDTTAINNQGRTYFANRVVVDDFAPLYELLGETASLNNISPAVLRSFLSRVNEVVRVDIPSKKVEVTYDQLEKLASSSDEIPKLLGFSVGASANTDHPYTLGQISTALKCSSHSKLHHRVVKRIRDELGVQRPRLG